MNKEFWLERWDRGEIGFHQEEVNSRLLQCWKELSAAEGARVFVPLCGKTRDMLWLSQRGHSVLGVELSVVAVEAFFNENGYTPDRVRGGDSERWCADGIEIICGDFFALTKSDLKDVSVVYDRASLVALPREMRARYARHLLSILPPATQILLVALDYPQAEMPGPPFAVPRTEIESLFGGRAEIRLLAQHDVIAQNPRFSERGLSRLQENVFLIKLP